jgi:catechol 2,3-dioxygenase-like lactoylglutathione lyase family enzyme
MEQRLSLVTLGVADLARARAFYVDGLGWRPSGAGNEEVVFIPLGGIVLGLWGREALAAEAHVALGSGFGGMALAHNVREKAEVDTVLATAEAAGAAILAPAKEMFWGGYSGYFADPDGHVWEVAWNPFWPIGEDGSVTLPV